MKPPSVAIVILNWDQEEVTADCLESLRNVKDVHTQIIVVDNGSHCESVDRLEQRFREALFLRLPENRGFAAGNNMGIDRALRDGASHIMVLNNDTLVQPNFLRLLLDCLDNPEVAVVGPKIYYYPEVNRVWFAGGVIDWQTGSQRSLGANEMDRGQWDTPRDVDYLAGCCFLSRAQVFEDIGGFDERYFIYFEETDWNLRASRRGYRRRYVPNSVIYHKVSLAMGTHSPNSDYFLARNRLLFLWTHAPKGRRPVLMALTTARTLRYAWTLHREGREENAVAIRQGVTDFFRRRFGGRPCRRA